MKCAYNEDKLNELVEQTEKVVDMVSHPPHYEGSTSLECIECMELVFGVNAVCFFCLCNSFKYLWRYKNKNGEEDVKKARWYLDYVEGVINRATSDRLHGDILIMYSRLNDLFVKVQNKVTNGLIKF